MFLKLGKRASQSGLLQFVETNHDGVAPVQCGRLDPLTSSKNLSKYSPFVCAEVFSQKNSSAEDLLARF